MIAIQVVTPVIKKVYFLQLNHSYRRIEDGELKVTYYQKSLQTKLQCQNVHCQIFEFLQN